MNCYQRFFDEKLETLPECGGNIFEKCPFCKENELPCQKALILFFVNDGADVYQKLAVFNRMINSTKTLVEKLSEPEPFNDPAHPLRNMRNTGWYIWIDKKMVHFVADLFACWSNKNCPVGKILVSSACDVLCLYNQDRQQMLFLQNQLDTKIVDFLKNFDDFIVTQIKPDPFRHVFL